MKFKIEFDMNNAAFDDYPESEIYSILDNVKTKVIDGFVHGRVRDANGNTIGYWTIETED